MTDPFHRRIASWVVAAACGAVMVATPLPARAGKLDETLDFSVHARASMFNAGAIGLRGGKGPALPSDTRLAGRARAFAPMLRGGLTFHGLRVGVGAGFEGYDGLRLAHEPLLPGQAITNGSVWGIPLEGFVAYAFRSGERVRPFIEARTTGTLIQARAQLDHLNDGRSGTLRMHATTFAVAAQAGVLVHLNECFFVEAGVGRVVYGTGGWTASAAIGIPIPLANL
jgi:hypothetical protein